jgi:hypothetical protein
VADISLRPIYWVPGGAPVASQRLPQLLFQVIAADRPGLGKPVTEVDLALWDISVAPDGAGLPSGSGTPAQGAIVYAQKCELCHGKEGQGGLMPR